MTIEKIIENLKTEAEKIVQQQKTGIFLNLLLNKALDYQRDGLLDTAKELYEKLIGINPQNSAAYNNLGNVVKDLEKDKVEGVKKALPHYENAVLYGPGNEIAHRNLGDAYHQLGNIEKAIEFYNKALDIAVQKEKTGQLQPRIPGWILELADIYAASGKKEEAQKAINSLIKLRPGIEKDKKFNELVTKYHCDGKTDNGVQLVYYPDKDRDGFGNPGRK